MYEIGQVFLPEHLFRQLDSICSLYNLEQTARAMRYARKKHEGQFRKAPLSMTAQEKVPYIVHPLTMACHAAAMGIHEDTVLAVCLLHDVCEDCGVRNEDLPFPDEIRHCVKLLTRTWIDGESRQSAWVRYYAGIENDDVACLVKVLDRCNNISLMALAFPPQKMKEYMEETEDCVLPLLDRIKRVDPVWSSAAFLLKYQMVSMIESIRALLATD